MDDRQIDNFLVLYKTGNMHSAARMLFISQQGLSKSVQSLEHELGVTLFERTRTGMVPTQAGEYFHERILGIRNEMRHIRDNLNTIATGRSEVRVPCSFGVLHGAYGAIKEFCDLNPNVYVRWKEFDDRRVERCVLEGKDEIGLAVRNPDLDQLSFESLFTRKKVLLVYEGHPLFSRQAIDFADLRGVPIAFEGEDFNSNRYLVDRCLDEGFFPTVVAETSEVTFCMDLASRHEALAVVPDFIASQSSRMDVRAIPFLDEGFVWEAGIIYLRDQRPQGICGRLADFLIDRRDEMCR